MSPSHVPRGIQGVVVLRAYPHAFLPFLPKISLFNVLSFFFSSSTNTTSSY